MDTDAISRLPSESKGSHLSVRMSKGVEEVSKCGACNSQPAEQGKEPLICHELPSRPESPSSTTWDTRPTYVGQRPTIFLSQVSRVCKYLWFRACNKLSTLCTIKRESRERSEDRPLPVINDPLGKEMTNSLFFVQILGTIGQLLFIFIFLFFPFKKGRL